MGVPTSIWFEVYTFIKKAFLTAFFAGLILILFYLTPYHYIINNISLWRIEEYSLVKDYIQIIFSWPIITLTLVLTFFHKFPEGINKFLENSRPKTPISESNIPDSQIRNNLESTNVAQEPSPENTVIQASQAENQYEFPYLNLYLVWETKIALASFFSAPYTQSNFINSYPLSKNVTNPEVEKTAILQALIENNLIIIDKTTRNILVTEKGERFLKAISIIPNELRSWVDTQSTIK